MSVDFDQLYERYIIGPHKVDPPELRSVLQRIVVESTQVETERAVLKELLLELANFLNSRDGHKSVYLKAVDQFFCDAEDCWMPRTAHVPSDIRDLFSDIGIDLHGGIDDPEHHTTPKQLLDMVNALEA